MRDLKVFYQLVVGVCGVARILRYVFLVVVLQVTETIYTNSSLVLGPILGISSSMQEDAVHAWHFQQQVQQQVQQRQDIPSQLMLHGSAHQTSVPDGRPGPSVTFAEPPDYQLLSRGDSSVTAHAQAAGYTNNRSVAMGAAGSSFMPMPSQLEVSAGVADSMRTVYGLGAHADHASRILPSPARPMYYASQESLVHTNRALPALAQKKCVSFRVVAVGICDAKYQLLCIIFIVHYSSSWCIMIVDLSAYEVRA